MRGWQQLVEAEMTRLMQPEVGTGRYLPADECWNKLLEFVRCPPDAALREGQAATPELLRYANHTSDCELRDTWTAQQKCTCGFTELLARIEAGDAALQARLEQAWQRLEWAGTIWTDTQCCLFCRRTLEGLPAHHEYPEEPPKTHEAGCEWVVLRDALAALAREERTGDSTV